MAGGAAFGLAALAAAVFPVLFIGLAAIMARTRDLMVRAGLGAVGTLLLLLVWPGLRGLAPCWPRSRLAGRPRRPGLPARPTSTPETRVTRRGERDPAHAGACSPGSSPMPAGRRRVVLLPEPEGALRTFVERLPAPLFAGLAVSNLLGGTTAWPEPPALCAALAAAATTPRRSLPLALVVGLAAYGVAELIW